MDNLEEMNKSLGTHNLPRLNHGDTENLKLGSFKVTYIAF